jgi:hypothetical protein
MDSIKYEDQCVTADCVTDATENKTVFSIPCQKSKWNKACHQESLAGWRIPQPCFGEKAKLVVPTGRNH